MKNRVKPDPLLPQTLEALLICTNCCKATKHEFVYSNRMVDGTTIEHIFECTSCKARRRWGLLALDRGKNHIPQDAETEEKTEETIESCIV